MIVLTDIDMNYKQQIEQKAREYALIPIDVNIDTYGTENQIEAYNDFLAGAEAMREMSNTWIPVTERTPENQDIVLVKSDCDCVCTAYCHGKSGSFITYGEDAYDDFGEITHWKPITL